MRAYWRRSGTSGFLVLLTLIVIGASVGTSFSQSLAELAEKEKKRRAEVDSPRKVITDRELQQSYGGLPPTPAAVPSEPSAEGDVSATAEGPPVGPGEAQEQGAEEESKTREYWEQRVSVVREKIQELETELNSPETDWGGGLRQDVNPLGQRNLERRQQLERDLAQARSELAAIQDEARRAGVPPGWVR